ncbi:outer membrane protein assembly factor BamB [Allocatelliglobosispora scoriae]|uniref:Outer membrane protein assembly factor BamB n=1 Tax=Allocatelliglobosispora scoriae TaxID=643052 RepID=A0A841BKR7_9ACTN|nr:PQQ-binding-like beta-propeller repeat protein [Allocatelliglobosispora scoriae]MBB5868874.1 outer membrane protein assembly factor BamB [Allocatelliglobosispora scoriae]
MVAGSEVMIELEGWQDRPVDRPPRPFPLTWRRRCAAVACAVAVLVTVGAAAAPAPPPPWRRMTTFVSGGDNRYSLVGDVLVAIEAGTTVAVARNLADERIRWRADFGLDSIRVLAASGTFVVGGLPVGIDDSARGIVLGVDPATGAVRWRHQGWLQSLTPDGQVAIVHDGTDQGLITAIDVRSGAERWHFEAGPQSLIGYAGDGLMMTWRGVTRPASYLVAKIDGSHIEISLDSGVATTLDRLDQGASVETIDDTTIVGRLPAPPEPGIDSPQQILVGYDRATRRELWRSEAIAGDDSVMGCGAILCQDHGDDVVARSPRTGKVLWTVPGVNAFGLWHRDTGDVIIMTSSADVAGRRLIDAASGALQADLGRWRAIGVVDGRLLVRLMDTSGPLTRTWLGVVAPTGAPVVRVLGLLGAQGAAVSDCWTQGAWLVCAVLGKVIVLDPLAVA